MNDDAKNLLVVTAILGIIGGALGGMLHCRLTSNCNTACDLRKGKVIGGDCHCITETGWERPTEKAQ